MARLRVATFNLLHGLALDTGLATPAGLAAAAAQLDADVVGLQEVDRGQDRSGGVDQTAVLAAHLGAAHHRFLPALVGAPGPGRAWVPGPGPAGCGNGSGPAHTTPAYGVGLLSRRPVRAWAARHFPAAPVSLPLLVPATPKPRLVRVPDEPRAALAAVLDTPAGPLTVITAHLSFVPGYNVRQLRALTRWARRFPAPRLLAGDVNLPGALPTLATGWRSLGRVATYPSYAPRVQFDHVLADGLGPDAVLEVRAQRLAVSDHCALVVELDLPGP